MRLCLQGEVMRLLVRLHARVEPAEREAQVAAERLDASTGLEVRRVAERALGVLQRFERFFVPIHDAQRRGDADPRAAMAGLIDREVERLAISGECVVRTTELQQQLAEQNAAL